MKANTVHTFEIDDEGDLQDALSGIGVVGQATQAAFVKVLRHGDAVIVRVPDQPPRAVVMKEAIEKLLGQTLPGGPVMAVPFA
jgi:hypothetical protein